MLPPKKYAVIIDEIDENINVLILKNKKIESIIIDLQQSEINFKNFHLVELNKNKS
jgi:ribosomal protein L14E/L6E/L27E